MSEQFEMVVKTFQGLEGVLSDELRALGAQNVEQGQRMVSFTGDKELMYRANFELRTALRVLKPIYKFRSTDADDLYEQVKRFDWSTLLTPEQTFAIDSTVNSETFRHSRFVTYRVKDAIADQFMERVGKRPGVRITSPDYCLNVHIWQDQVTISLDSSGEPLYKRGWRVAQTEAPINEVLAAGILKLAGWEGQCDLVDPMCGSGTFLVEAAMMATGTSPGLYRKGYAFQQWPDYDAQLFSDIYNDDSKEREFTHKIYGSDIAGQAVAMSRANVKSAGMSRYVELQLKDLNDIDQAPAKDGMLVTNPPYGERLKPENLEGIYTTLGQKLKNVFTGYKAWVIGYSYELTDLIGLKTSVRYPLMNGELECELREYVIFDGKFKDMRREGGSIKNTDFHASDRDRGARHHEFKATFEGKEGDKQHDDRRPRRFDKDKDKDDRRPRRFDKDKDDRRPRRFDKDKDDRRPRRFDKDKDDRRPRRFDKDKDDRRPRRFDKDKDDRRSRRFDKDKDEQPRDEQARLMGHDEFFFSSKNADRVVRHRQPTLGKDSERPIVRGRRNGWKRRGLDDNAAGCTPAPQGDEPQQ